MPPRPLRAALGGGLAALLVAGCTTLRETQPTHTATEQLLMSHAAEIAAGHLADALPPDGSVWIDDSHFKGDGSDYALGAIQAAFMKRGLVLAPDQKSSHLTVALRMGALSIDQSDTILGLPAGYLPIPGTLSAFPIPEISVYSSNRRIGVAEFSAYAYVTATHQPVAFAGPAAGERKLILKKYLTVFGSGSRVEEPGPPKPKR
jgi:hypothetical protein